MGDNQSLQRTPLFDLHTSLGARMVGFAGYEMPVQYPDGVLKEHLHTRAHAGLFDVSHMGLVSLRATSGDVADAARALETVLPVDVLGLKEGRQRYGFFTNDQGGIIDDLMFGRASDRLILVVNAANKTTVIAHLQEHLSDQCQIDVHTDQALIAIQGPDAQAVLMPHLPAAGDMRFMDTGTTEMLGVQCHVSRSGYTGEDGFEIAIPADQAQRIVEALLADERLKPIGLGARDSLRLEAGLCLHGNDIDTSTTPVEAGLTWAIQKVRRRGGAREGGFPGAEVILAQLEEGPTRMRVGLRPEGRAPVRAGANLFADEASDTAVGMVTSGGFGPTVEAPVSMGYLPTALAEVGTRVFAEVRGKRLPVAVAAMPFITPNYKR